MANMLCSRYTQSNDPVKANVRRRILENKAQVHPPARKVTTSSNQHSHNHCAKKWCELTAACWDGEISPVAILLLIEYDIQQQFHWLRGCVYHFC